MNMAEYFPDIPGLTNIERPHYVLSEREERAKALGKRIVASDKVDAAYKKAKTQANWKGKGHLRVVE